MTQESEFIGHFEDAEASLNSLINAIRTRTGHFASASHRKGVISLVLASEPPMTLLWLLTVAVDRLLEGEKQ